MSEAGGGASSSQESLPEGTAVEAPPPMQRFGSSFVAGEDSPAPPRQGCRLVGKRGRRRPTRRADLAFFQGRGKRR